MLSNNNSPRLMLMNSSAKATTIYGRAILGLLIGGAMFLVGCNSHPSGEISNSPPKLSIGSDQGDNNPATQSGNQAPPNSSTASTGQADNPHAKLDPELEALINQVEDNVKAWQEGKAYDFAPVASKICQRLDAKLDEPNVQLSADAAQVFVMAGEYDSARSVYTALEKAAKDVQPSPLAQMALEIAHGGLTRLNLLNTAPTIKGTVLGGEKFDWNQYRGKVVLIDFWATWCPHCVEELPDVKQVYDKYHDQGFDVVGISLDDDKQKLTDFLTQKKLPWVTLFDDDPAKQGWDGAAMTKPFAIEALPTMLLIDRAGKIVSISARGEELPQQVEKLLAEKR